MRQAFPGVFGISLLVQAGFPGAPLQAQGLTEKLGPLIAEVRQATGGKDAKGRLGPFLERLRKMKPSEKSPEYDIYLGAMGELLFLNGDYAASATYARSTRGGRAYNWGVWNKIVEALCRSVGYDAAKAEYEFALSRVKGQTNQDLFATEVGGVLARFKPE